MAFRRRAVQNTQIGKLEKRVEELSNKLTKALQENDELNQLLKQKDEIIDNLQKQISQPGTTSVTRTPNPPTTYEQHLPTTQQNFDEPLFSKIDEIKNGFYIATALLYRDGDKENPVLNARDWILILYLGCSNTCYKGFLWYDKQSVITPCLLYNTNQTIQFKKFQKNYNFKNIVSWEQNYKFNDLNSRENGIFIGFDARPTVKQISVNDIVKIIKSTHLWKVPDYGDDRVKNILKTYLPLEGEQIYIDKNVPYQQYYEDTLPKYTDKDKIESDKNELEIFLFAYFQNHESVEITNQLGKESIVVINKETFERFNVSLGLDVLVEITRDMITRINRVSSQFPFNDDEFDFLTFDRTVIVEKEQEGTMPIFAMYRIDNLLNSIVDPYQVLLCFDIMYYKLKFMYELFGLNLYAKQWAEPYFEDSIHTLVPKDFQEKLKKKWKNGYDGSKNITENYGYDQSALVSGVTYIFKDINREKGFWVKYLKQNLFRCTTKRLLNNTVKALQERKPAVKFQVKGDWEGNKKNTKTTLIIDGKEYVRTDVYNNAVGLCPLNALEFWRIQDDEEGDVSQENFKTKYLDVWRKEKMVWINSSAVRMKFYNNIWKQIEKDLLEFIKIELDERYYLEEITWTSIAIYLNKIPSQSDNAVLFNFKENFMYRIFDLIFDGLLKNYDSIRKIDIENLKKPFYELPFLNYF